MRDHGLEIIGSNVNGIKGDGEARSSLGGHIECEHGQILMLYCEDQAWILMWWYMFGHISLKNSSDFLH